MGQDDHLARVENCTIERTRNGSEHIKNCDTGFRPALRFMWQSHHIVPVSAVSDSHIAASDEKNKEFIIGCLCMTPWNVNASHNVIGLDTKWPYKLHPVNKILPDNLPSHLIDHSLYTQETYEYMEAQVWDELKDRRQIHKLEPKSILQELKDASDYFRGELTTRGSRNGGTVVCWSSRFNAGKGNAWYHPFSMADPPSRRNPGIPNAVHWLDNVFSKIK